jgi:DNA-binding transcriptional ArsR family regulator
MEGVLWYVLASSRGATRARVVRALDERPRNANQLAEELDLDYRAVRHDRSS